MSEKESKKTNLTKLNTSRTGRNFAMTKMGVVAGTQMAGHMFFNLFRDGQSREASDRAFFEKQARFLADELGKLKGSVMKVGQMLSLYGQYFMPPEAVEVLRELQDDTVHVDWSVMEPVLKERLGADRLAELDIDHEPLAAASLGQVHIARRKSDGKKLCVKIQYPGVAAAIDSDISSLSNLVTIARLVPKGIQLRPIMEEVRDMLHQEVDYNRELEMTRAFGEYLKDDSRFVVPEVFPEYSNDLVLTTSFEAADHVQSDAVQSLSQTRRNKLGEAGLHLFFKEFFRWGRVQTDPHFGNYRIRVDQKGENDQFVLLDFGATREFRQQFLDAYYQVVAGAWDRNQQRLINGARGLGLLRPDFPADVQDAFTEVCFLVIEPFTGKREVVPAELLTNEGAYKWGDSDLPHRVSAAVAKAAISRHFRIPPREIVFLHRRLGGIFVLLAVLRAEVNGHELLGEYLSDVADLDSE